MKGKRVVIALSGGVDSSVAAALLKEQGYEVIAISMQLYDQSKLEDSRFDSCCSLKEVDVARRVAQILDIPYYVLNFEKVFKENVVDYFVDEYLKGRTPNPCVRCNTDVKFKHLIEKAKQLKADYLATGHYVINEYNKALKRYELKKAVDRRKDQSYFLYGTDPKELPFLLFPLGRLTKPEVREIAQKYNLPNANKAESMEICFIPNNDYASFVKSKLANTDNKGNILNKKGEVLGKHEAYYNYTVGQRKGLGVSSKDPLYVLNVNPKTKDVTIGQKVDLDMRGLLTKQVNWISQPIGNNVTLKIRHSVNEIASTLQQPHTKELKISFKKPQKAISPGQAAVFYQGDVLLGGGWIEKGIH
jgi:tRNA-uridine 2-sulfurtransferase